MFPSVDSLAEFTPQNASTQHGSFWDKPNLKSVHSRLGSCTCNFKLRVWGRLNYLEDLLGQHKPCQSAAGQARCHPGCGDPCCWCSITAVCSVQCGAVGSHPVKQFLCGLFLGLASLLGLFLRSKFEIKVKLSQSAKVSWLQVETKQKAHSWYGFNLKS